jgi:homoserine kinase
MTGASLRTLRAACGCEDAAPVTPGERYAIIDIIRGFSLFGVLLANMVLTTQFMALSGAQREALPTAVVDQAALFLIDTLVAETFRRTLARDGVVPAGVLRLRSDIPVARGLGASAAAVLAGYDLARAVRAQARDDDGAFGTALRHEGHGDNAAPSLFGGLRAVARTADGPVVIQLVLSEEVGFAYSAPAAGISTKEAREILPSHVPHKMAAATLGRLVALVRGLAEGNPELIRIGVRDELHVPHRIPLIPSANMAMSAAADAGAWAVTVSGAGSRASSRSKVPQRLSARSQVAGVPGTPTDTPLVTSSGVKG